MCASTHTASLIASDLKGTEEPDGAFRGGAPPEKLAIPNQDFTQNGSRNKQALPLTT